METFRSIIKTLKLSLPQDWQQAMSFSLLPLLLPAVSLLFGTPIPLGFRSALWMVLWAFMEELGFRGILSALMERVFSLSPTRNALLVNLLFALFHLLNLRSGALLPDTLLQCIFAFGIGFLFSALADETGSLLPSFILHTLINLSASTIEAEHFLLFALITLLLSVGAFIYGFLLFRQHRKKESES